MSAIRSMRTRFWRIAGFAAAIMVALALTPVAQIQRTETAGTPDTLGASFESRRLTRDGVSRPRVLIRLQPDNSEEARKANHKGTMPLVAEVWQDGLEHEFRVLCCLDERARTAI